MGQHAYIVNHRDVYVYKLDFSGKVQKIYFFK